MYTLLDCIKYQCQDSYVLYIPIQYTPSVWYYLHTLFLVQTHTHDVSAPWVEPFGQLQLTYIQIYIYTNERNTDVFSYQSIKYRLKKGKFTRDTRLIQSTYHPFSQYFAGFVDTEGKLVDVNNITEFPKILQKYYQQ